MSKIERKPARFFDDLEKFESKISNRFDLSFRHSRMLRSMVHNGLIANANVNDRQNNKALPCGRAFLQSVAWDR